jgi:hypothetical protein
VFKLAVRGVRFNIGRYVATLLAIITGVAFFAASGFVADRVIVALEGDVDRQYGSVDAAVIADDTRRPSHRCGRRSAHRGRCGRRIAALPEVAGVAGELTGDVAFLGDDGEVFADGAPGVSGSTTPSSIRPTSRSGRRRSPPARSQSTGASPMSTTSPPGTPSRSSRSPDRSRPPSPAPPGSATRTPRTVAARCRFPLQRHSTG